MVYANDKAKKLNFFSRILYKNIQKYIYRMKTLTLKSYVKHTCNNQKIKKRREKLNYETFT